MYIPRYAERKFLNLNNCFKVMLVTGARQVGKTTMLRHLAEGSDRTYVSLDDPLARDLALSDPVGFFETYPPPVLIDEVQYAPPLFPVIKLLADQEETTGRFWLTGSQHYAMMRNIQESLAGRIGIMRMYGLTQGELAGVAWEPIHFDMESLRRRAAAYGDRWSTAHVPEFIWKGSLPRVHAVTPNAEAYDTFFSSYVESYLLRDATQVGGVQESARFFSFLRAAAALIGQQVNYSGLAEAVGVTQATARRWLETLVGLGIVYLLEPFASNTLKRLARTPKLYFTDTGVAAWLGKWPTAETLMAGAASGAFFENYVVMELLRNLSAGPSRFSLSYLRDANKTEIDVILEQDRTMHPLEIKQGSHPRLQETRKFTRLEGLEMPRGRGGIICSVQQPIAIGDSDSCIPSWIL